MLREQKPPEEKLLLGLVWDETKFQREGGTKGEPMEELIPVQVYPTNPTKGIRIEALLPKDVQKNFRVVL